MKTKYLIGILIVGMVLISGCKTQETPQQITCNKPYILIGNSCCLDQNDDNICDKDEPEVFETQKVSGGWWMVECPKKIFLSGIESKSLDFKIQSSGSGDVVLQSYLECPEGCSADVLPSGFFLGNDDEETLKGSITCNHGTNTNCKLVVYQTKRPDSKSVCNFNVVVI